MIFLCYELSVCPLILNSNKVYFASSLIARSNFYSCQINKSDLWLQFEKNEKNPPVSADMQKIINKSNFCCWLMGQLFHLLLFPKRMIFDFFLPWFAFLNCSMPIIATGDCCNSLAIFCSTKKNIYSSKSSLIKWKDPNEAADLNVRSRIIIELERNKKRISNEKGV